jgi:chromosomal replication initiator protein
MICSECKKNLIEYDEIYKLSAEDIIDKVCQFYGLEKNRVRKKDRHQELIDARFMIYYILRNNVSLNLGLKKIGKYTGNQDHTTVINGLKKVKNYLEIYPEYRKKMHDCINFVYNKTN